MSGRKTTRIKKTSIKALQLLSLKEDMRTEKTAVNL